MNHDSGMPSYLHGASISIKVHSRVILEKVHVITEAELKAFLVVVYQLAIYVLPLCISRMISTRIQSYLFSAYEMVNPNVVLPFSVLLLLGLTPVFLCRSAGTGCWV